MAFQIYSAIVNCAYTVGSDWQT